MNKKYAPFEVKLDAIIGGGQAIGSLESGKKIMVWGGLPGETVLVQPTKRKKNYLEGIVSQVISASPRRIEPLDRETYLSTSPWQIMDFALEQQTKAQLIAEAFELHGVVLPQENIVKTNGTEGRYRNKVEFSWYSQTDPETGEDSLDLAFFRRGSKGKLTLDDSHLLPSAIIDLALNVRDCLRTKAISARQLKTLLIRCDQAGNCVWQLYVKDSDFQALTVDDLAATRAQGAEVIYSDPRSPASRITKRLLSHAQTYLTDEILGVPFRYATESFFQVNIPMYELALGDMATWVDQTKPTLDLYAGVGSIGLTIGGANCELIEINEQAVAEMKQNIDRLGKSASAVLAPSEAALDYITADKTIIVDPPRAGLHADVTNRLLEVLPERIIYLSCNPATQARDVSRLLESYSIAEHIGYNFFPRTPHIEHLVVLERLPTEPRA